MRGFMFGAALLLAAMPSGAPAQTATMGFADAAEAFALACGSDIDRHCRQANLGSGRIEACLQQHSTQISAVCRTAVPEIRARVAARIQAQHGVFRICDADVARRCAGIRGEANVLSCLLRARASVSASCNAAIDNAGWR
jgi:hypothetical protein